MIGLKHYKLKNAYAFTVIEIFLAKDREAVDAIKFRSQCSERFNCCYELVFVSIFLKREMV